MKPFALIIIIGLACSGCTLWWASSEPFHAEYSSGIIQQIAIKNTSGSVTVASEPGTDRIVVEGTRYSSIPGDIPESAFRLSVVGGILTVETDPWGISGSVGADYILTIPEGTPVGVVQDTGNVTLDGSFPVSLLSVQTGTVRTASGVEIEEAEVATGDLYIENASVLREAVVSTGSAWLTFPTLTSDCMVGISTGSLYARIPRDLPAVIDADTAVGMITGPGFTVSGPYLLTMTVGTGSIELTELYTSGKNP